VQLALQPVSFPINYYLMQWYKKLHWQIIIGLILGLIWGLVSTQVGLNDFTSEFIRPVGTIFVNLLKFIAIPLVLASLVVGVANLNDITKLSRMGGKTILFFLITTIFAITIGLLVVNLMKPGYSLPEETREELLMSYSDNLEQRKERAEDVLTRGRLQPIVDIVPENAVEAMANNSNMLQVVFIAIILGIGIIQINAKQRDTLVNFFEAFNDVIIKIVDFIMILAPYGVFALLASVIIDLAGDDLKKAFNLLQALGWYSIAVIAGLLIHLFVVYTALLKIYSNMGIFEFLRGIRPAILLGFSTSSSAATLPVTMERVERNLGVHEEVASFVLPVGATINMNGTSLYQAIAAVFIAQAVGMDLTIGQQLTIVLTATLASIGAAGVPGAGIIMLVIVLNAIEVPVEGVALILGVDRILDMCRTAVNITGDAAVAVAVASTEGKIVAGNYDE